MHDVAPGVDHDEHMPVHPVLLRDQTEGEDPTVWRTAWRYMDRMFAERRDHRRVEIASIDLDALSPRMRYLMRHLLILQGRYRQMLDDFPNLRGLQQDTEIDRPIILSDPPRHTWSYFKRKGIWL